VEECPEGYPRLAAFSNSDENFMIYRRFGYLQSRILLHKQDELQRLEQELEEMDQKDASGENPHVSQRWEDDEAGTNKGSNARPSLLNTIKEKFLEYSKYSKSIRYSVFGKFH
jgi:hypothetical protein